MPHTPVSVLGVACLVTSAEDAPSSTCSVACGARMSVSRLAALIVGRSSTVGRCLTRCPYTTTFIHSRAPDARSWGVAREFETADCSCVIYTRTHSGRWGQSWCSPVSHQRRSIRRRYNFLRNICWDGSGSTWPACCVSSCARLGLGSWERGIAAKLHSFAALGTGSLGPAFTLISRGTRRLLEAFWRRNAHG